MSSSQGESLDRYLDYDYDYGHAHVVSGLFCPALYTPRLSALVGINTLRPVALQRQTLSSALTTE